jgi:hypothetical protein
MISSSIQAATTLSVSQLYDSHPDVAIATLEGAITASPSAALIEPLIFNITTLYELRLSAAAAMERKIELLVKVRLSLPHATPAVAYADPPSASGCAMGRRRLASEFLPPRS